MLVGVLTRGTRLTGVLSSGGRSGPDSYVPIDVEDIVVDDVVISDMIGELLQAPPISFQSAGSALLDYVIYGADGGVGDLVDSRYIIPVKIAGKNLFNEEYDPPIEESMQYLPIYVGDGSFTLSSDIPLNSENYANLFLMSGANSSGGSTAGNGVWNEHPQTKTSAEGFVTIAYRNYNRYGSPISPSDYNVQLESGTTATAYEPYFNETVTVNLDFPLYYDDAITMTDAGVTIPTVIGSNTLTVGTTVQPAAVQIKYQN